MLFLLKQKRPRHRRLHAMRETFSVPRPTHSSGVIGMTSDVRDLAKFFDLHQVDFPSPWVVEASEFIKFCLAVADTRRCEHPIVDKNYWQEPFRHALPADLAIRWDNDAYSPKKCFLALTGGVDVISHFRFSSFALYCLPAQRID